MWQGVHPLQVSSDLWDQWQQQGTGKNSTTHWAFLCLPSSGRATERNSLTGLPSPHHQVPGPVPGYSVSRRDSSGRLTSTDPRQTHPFTIILNSPTPASSRTQRTNHPIHPATPTYCYIHTRQKGFMHFNWSNNKMIDFMSKTWRNLETDQFIIHTFLDFLPVIH